MNMITATIASWLVVLAIVKWPSLLFVIYFISLCIYTYTRTKDPG